MGISTLVRLLAGVVLFIYLARLLGPGDFGRLMVGFTLASIAVLVIEYGFSLQLLRDVGKAPGQICAIMGRVFLAKVLLIFLVVGCIQVWLVIFPRSAEDQLIFWLLFLACTFASFADFLNVPFRCIGRFHEETKIVIASSIFHFGVLLTLALLGSNLVTLAQGFVVSRMLNLAISWMAYRRIIGGFEFGGQSWKTPITTLKNGFSYAADSGITNLFYQIDTLIINHYLGVASVGLYQAAMRFLNGVMQIAPVLANVYIPTIASLLDQKEQLEKIVSIFNTKMLAVGLLGGLLFSLLGNSLSDMVYGGQYKELTGLWPYFGLLIFLRYLSGCLGTLLMAAGFQKMRVYVQILAICLLVLTAPVLIQKNGLAGMLIALQINVFFVFLLYLGTAIKFKQPTGFNLTKSAIIFAAIMLGFSAEFLNLFKGYDYERNYLYIWWMGLW